MKTFCEILGFQTILVLFLLSLVKSELHTENAITNVPQFPTKVSNSLPNGENPYGFSANVNPLYPSIGRKLSIVDIAESRSVKKPCRGLCKLFKKRLIIPIYHKKRTVRYRGWGRPKKKRRPKRRRRPFFFRWWRRPRRKPKRKRRPFFKLRNPLKRKRKPSRPRFSSNYHYAPQHFEEGQNHEYSDQPIEHEGGGGDFNVQSDQGFKEQPNVQVYEHEHNNNQLEYNTEVGPSGQDQDQGQFWSSNPSEQNQEKPIGVGIPFYVQPDADYKGGNNVEYNNHNYGNNEFEEGNGEEYNNFQSPFSNSQAVQPEIDNQNHFEYDNPTYPGDYKEQSQEYSNNGQSHNGPFPSFDGPQNDEYEQHHNHVQPPQHFDRPQEHEHYPEHEENYPQNHHPEQNEQFGGGYNNNENSYHERPEHNNQPYHNNPDEAPFRHNNNQHPSPPNNNNAYQHQNQRPNAIAENNNVSPPQQQSERPGLFRGLLQMLKRPFLRQESTPAQTQTNPQQNYQNNVNSQGNGQFGYSHRPPFSFNPNPHPHHNENVQTNHAQNPPRPPKDAFKIQLHLPSNPFIKQSAPQQSTNATVTPAPLQPRPDEMPAALHHLLHSPMHRPNGPQLNAPNSNPTQYNQQQKEPEVIYGQPMSESKLPSSGGRKHPFSNHPDNHPEPHHKIKVVQFPGASNHVQVNSNENKSKSKSFLLPSKFSTLPDKIEEFRPDPSHKKLPDLTYDAMKYRSVASFSNTNSAIVKFTPEDAKSKRKRKKIKKEERKS